MALRAVPDHPKFAKLKHLLKLPDYAVLGCLESLWHFGGRYTAQGDLGKYTNAEIESWIQWDGKKGALIAALIKAGWVDIHPEHRLLIHDWSQHAGEFVHTELARKCLLFADGVVPNSRRLNQTEREVFWEWLKAEGLEKRPVGRPQTKCRPNADSLHKNADEMTKSLSVPVSVPVSESGAGAEPGAEPAPEPDPVPVEKQRRKLSPLETAAPLAAPERGAASPSPTLALTTATTTTTAEEANAEKPPHERARDVKNEPGIVESKFRFFCEAVGYELRPIEPRESMFGRKRLEERIEATSTLAQANEDLNTAIVNYAAANDHGDWNGLVGSRETFERWLNVKNNQHSQPPPVEPRMSFDEQVQEMLGSFTAQIEKKRLEAKKD